MLGTSPGCIGLKSLSAFAPKTFSISSMNLFNGTGDEFPIFTVRKGATGDRLSYEKIFLSNSLFDKGMFFANRSILHTKSSI